MICASGYQQLDKSVLGFKGYIVVKTIESRKEILDSIVQNKPDILLVSNGLNGDESLYEILVNVSKISPSTRIIYLCGEILPSDKQKIDAIGFLTMFGIYDVIYEKRLNSALLKDILDNPKSKKDVEVFLQKVRNIEENISKERNFNFVSIDESETLNPYVYKNVFTFSSIKPGSGKTFVSSNIASAIAKYGEEKNGVCPKVAIIEADLQNLSLSTVFGLDDTNNNIKNVFEKISKYVVNNKFIGSENEQSEIHDTIMRNFLQPEKNKSLYVLGGSSLFFRDIQFIRPEYYTYLIDEISAHFDVVIIDLNSSMSHTTTYPLLEMSNTCYFILNLDYNNIRNNIRYREYLDEIDILSKTKYILNQAVENNKKTDIDSGVEFEKLDFTERDLTEHGFVFEGKIPLVPYTVMCNRLYSATPLVFEKEKYTRGARAELFKIANQIWPLKNIDKLILQ